MLHCYHLCLHCGRLCRDCNALDYRHCTYVSDEQRRYNRPGWQRALSLHTHNQGHIKHGLQQLWDKHFSCGRPRSSYLCIVGMPPCEHLGELKKRVGRAHAEQAAADLATSALRHKLAAHRALLHAKAPVEVNISQCPCKLSTIQIPASSARAYRQSKSEISLRLEADLP